MDVTSWQRRERRFTRRNVDEFYHRPLSEVNLFNFITSSVELPRHGGSFSIKLALAGEEEYSIGRRTLRVRPGTFLLVNGGEVYGSRIRLRTHSLSLFFPDCDVAAAQASLTGDARDALEGPATGVRPAEVPQFCCRISPQTMQPIRDLVRALRQHRLDVAEEAVAALLGDTLRDVLGLGRALAIDQVRKASTRDELIGRIVRARDYVADMRGRDCSLERLAQVACLSKFHFLRLFRQAFGTSPVAYARARRIEEAERALARGDSEDQAAAAGAYASRHSLRRALRVTRQRLQISNPGWARAANVDP